MPKSDSYQDDQQHPPWLYNELQQVGTDYAGPAHVQAYDLQMQKLRDTKQETSD